MEKRRSSSVSSIPQYPSKPQSQLRAASYGDLLDQPSPLQKVDSSASFNSQRSIADIPEDTKLSDEDPFDEDDEDLFDEDDEDCIHMKMEGEASAKTPGPVRVKAVGETVKSHQSSNSFQVMVTSKRVECAGSSLVIPPLILPFPLPIKSRSVSVLSEGSPDPEMKQLIVHEMECFDCHQCSREEKNNVAPVPAPLLPDSSLFVSPIAVSDDCSSSEVVAL